MMQVCIVAKLLHFWPTVPANVELHIIIIGATDARDACFFVFTWPF